MGHSSSDLVKRLGVTREMLRYWEEAGLIAPKRDEGNRYRSYSDRDGFEVLRIKMLQSYQFSARQVSESLESQSLDAQVAYLMDVETNLERQISLLQAHLMRVRKHRSFAEDAMQPPDYVAEMETFGIYRLLMLGEGTPPLPELTARAGEWIAQAPITEIGWALPWPKDEAAWQGKLAAQIGMLAMPHCVQEHALCVEPPVDFFPAGHSLRMMVRTRDPFCIEASALSPLRRYAQERGWTVISDVSGRYSGCAFEDGERVYYFSARVIVQPAGE